MANCKYYPWHGGAHRRTALGLSDQRGGGGDRRPLVVAVLRDVMFGNRRHFRVLQQRSEEGIASNILADRLRRLVTAGLLTRADVGRGRRATYSLTEAAIELVPVLAMLGEWGLRNRPGTPTLRVRAQLLADGGPALWEDSMAELRASTSGRPRRKAAARPRASAWPPPTPTPLPPLSRDAQRGS
jgi:DNA-binding HxlR family transcriptional regulator